MLLHYFRHCRATILTGILPNRLDTSPVSTRCRIGPMNGVVGSRGPIRNVRRYWSEVFVISFNGFELSEKWCSFEFFAKVDFSLYVVSFCLLDPSIAFSNGETTESIA